MKKDTNKYRGETKRKFKQENAKTKGSTPGSEKVETCKATQLDKALSKYPRSHKTMTDLYINYNLKKDIAADRDNTFFTRNFKKKS